MQRSLEDWEWDMVLAGDASDELVARAKQQPEYEQRLNEAHREERRLFHLLYRTDCPTPLELGEWHLRYTSPERAREIQLHVADCPHCREELANLLPLLSEPVGGASRPGAGWLKRIVMRLDESLSQSGTPAVALRGESRSSFYTAGEFRLSLTHQENSRGTMLLGSLLASQATGRACLIQEGATRFETELSSAATFSFDGVPPGQYELVIRTPEAELVVPDLILQG